jgi:hypothetical protein
MSMEGGDCNGKKLEAAQEEFIVAISFHEQIFHHFFGI